MFSLKLLSLAMLVMSSAVFAAIPLDAGGQMQQIPPSSQSQLVAPALEVGAASQSVDAQQDSAKIVVNRIQVTGA